LVDLNEPISGVSEGEDISNQEIVKVPDTNNTTSSTDANNKAGTSKAEVAQGNPGNQGDSGQAVTDGSLLEFDVVDDPQKVNANDTKAAEEKTKKAETKKQESQSVMKPETLYFKAENGLLWPVDGNVLMNYSMDRVIYYETLEQFKCNPAIIIDAKVGTEVLSAATGIITSIEKEDETGLTVTTSIGSGYSLVYGQLDNVKLKVGDTVKAGEAIGKVAEPSKYYTVEGSNLYFQVLKDDSTIDPMLLLK
jgi:septal ring factor EnvC (AmiA/AmiB activator)